MIIEGPIAHHKLLGIGVVYETQGEHAIVYFPKTIPLNQLFPSKEAMLGDWRNDTINFIEEFKKTKEYIEKSK